VDRHPHGNCVEARADDDGGVQVRDIKVGGGGALAFTGPERDATIQGVKAGEFDC
jgi:Domain of unknown function (DUF397)